MPGFFCARSKSARSRSVFMEARSSSLEPENTLISLYIRFWISLL